MEGPKANARGENNCKHKPCDEERRTKETKKKWSVCESTFQKMCLTSAKKSKLPSRQVFGVFALEVNKILQATPSKLRREMGMGMCATTQYVQQQQ